MDQRVARGRGRGRRGRARGGPSVPLQAKVVEITCNEVDSVACVDGADRAVDVAASLVSAPAAVRDAAVSSQRDLLYSTSFFIAVGRAESSGKQSELVSVSSASSSSSSASSSSAAASSSSASSSASSTAAASSSASSAAAASSSASASSSSSLLSASTALLSPSLPLSSEWPSSEVSDASSAWPSSSPSLFSLLWPESHQQHQRQQQTLDAIDVSVFYSLSAAFVHEQVKARLPRGCRRTVFHSIKTVVPRVLLDWSATPLKPVPTHLVLLSGARIPLCTKVAASCLDEWLGSDWAMRVYAAHTAEGCWLGRSCVQHRTVSFIPTVTLRASAIGDGRGWSKNAAAAVALKASASASASPSLLYELRISGTIRGHGFTHLEALDVAMEREVTAILGAERDRKLPKAATKLATSMLLA